MTRKFLALLTVVLMAFAGCKQKEKRAADAGAVPPSVQGVIQAFTSGEISRASSIKVVFTTPVVGADVVGTQLENNPFEFEPPVDGTAYWTGRGLLEFKPARPLPSGAGYKARLDLGKLGLKGLSGELAFSFSVMPQTFSLNVSGLESRLVRKPQLQWLVGVVLTGDVAEPEEVERCVSVTHEGEKVAISWQHGARRHQFAAGPVQRRDKDTTLVVAWDASALGLQGQKGTREIVVPGKFRFDVLSAAAVESPERHVEVRFSEPLKRANLKGLVVLEDIGGQKPRKVDYRYTLEASILKLYPRKMHTKLRVTVLPGVRGTSGGRLAKKRRFEVSFAKVKPAVKFATKGVVLPAGEKLILPVEAAELKAVRVRAIAIYASNIPQFLQVNGLDGDRELKRVGRVVWKKRIELNPPPDASGRFVRYGLDITPLVKKFPGGFIRLELGFGPDDILYRCPAGSFAGIDKLPFKPWEMPEEEYEESESSNWDQVYQYLALDYWEMQEHRNDPCHLGYYRKWYDHDIRVARNVFVSSLGLIGKRAEDGSLLVVVTSLAKAVPLGGVKVKVLDYQLQPLSEGLTDEHGMVKLQPPRKPYLVIAERGDERGYLRLDSGDVLSLAHFDVGGVGVERGIKGFIYGERGVWRPGDTIYLTFVLHDPLDVIPPDHPVHFELLDSRGILVSSRTVTSSADGFYTFPTSTSPDAPTGNYTARVTVGDVKFERIVKVETVKPNRLKIELKLDAEEPLRAGRRMGAKLSSSWLHGAPASNLKADVELSLLPRPTRFKGYEEFRFDDPTRRFDYEPSEVFSGQLDEKGEASFRVELPDERSVRYAPGMLTANFGLRVYEPSGAYSVGQLKAAFSPYPRYIGIRPPKGDKARGMLLTDKKQTVQLVAVTPSGKPTDAIVEVKLYKIRWRWWWEKGTDDLARYSGTSSMRPVASGTVEIKNGRGSWDFMVKYPQWGRFLLVAEDTQGGHRAGKVVYIDWPGWAGKARKDMPGGASVITLAAERQKVEVGQEAAVEIPTPVEGRALVTLETGSQVLDARWIEAKGERTRFTFKASEGMSPGVYVSVMLLQPYEHSNDRPIRMYGVVPIEVVDPKTRLQPVIDCADVFEPNQTAEIRVAERSGRAMTYTLAVVDEGLLGLTGFTTPDPWKHFYAREALGVRTWDLFDDVLGAYGAELERMLAIGGGDEAEGRGRRRVNRFPPMVKFLGPFALKEGEKNTHRIELPNYLGAVRVMVVAGHDGAYGNAEKTVPVKKPVMILATLPRLLGVRDRAALPVSIFVTEPGIEKVRVKAVASGAIRLLGAFTSEVRFDRPGDKMVDFMVEALPVAGVGRVSVEATAGSLRASQQMELSVRMPSVAVTNVVAGNELALGESWTADVTPLGIAGTNRAVLEVSRIPPMDLERRLGYLIRYPHGCAEQTTSSVFPQLYLASLVDLTPEQQRKISSNVTTAIDKLQRFQTPDGGFAMWPGAGGFWSGQGARPDDWISSYVGHFMLEAKKAGFDVPDGVIERWRRYQRREAGSWTAGDHESSLPQAYRLYTLALARRPELAAMNRLREHQRLEKTSRWMLAAAYKLAGQQGAAEKLIEGLDPADAPDYPYPGPTYGSSLRDMAIALETLIQLGRREQATR
ncbi:MAG: hypothetical protein D6806_10090, partial [Deltaproteobacteria bacterium]